MEHITAFPAVAALSAVVFVAAILSAALTAAERRARWLSSSRLVLVALERVQALGAHQRERAARELVADQHPVAGD